MSKNYEKPVLASEEDWLLYRAKCVTGSDVAALFGEHPYKSRSALLASKMSGAPERIPDNGPMWFGREMEDPNREAFGKLTGMRSRGTHAFLVSKDCPKLAATLDGLAIFPESGITKHVPYWATEFLQGQFPVRAKGLGLMELKNSEKVPSAIPPHHKWQIHAQLAVSGLPWCVYIVKAGAAKFRAWFVPREEKTCIRIYNAVEEFFTELEEAKKEFGYE